MNWLQVKTCLVASLIVLSDNGIFGARLPGDNGYIYDKPAILPGNDFGRRINPDYPDALAGNNNYGRAGFSRGTSINNGFAYPTGQQSPYQEYPDYRGNYQGNYRGYQAYRDDGRFGAYQGYNTNEGTRPMPYSFQYEVKDGASGNDYGQQESGDGNGNVRGEYRVLLPDSRTQIVRYTADDANGYVADVRYEGQAQFFPNQYSNPGRFLGDFGSAYRQGFNGAVAASGSGNVNRVGFQAANQYLPPAGTYGK
ncbi:hypothetical protein TKK_0017335 [Trichogramma kaykai]